MSSAYSTIGRWSYGVSSPVRWFYGVNAKLISTHDTVGLSIVAGRRNAWIWFDGNPKFARWISRLPLRFHDGDYWVICLDRDEFGFGFWFEYRKFAIRLFNVQLAWFKHTQ